MAHMKVERRSMRPEEYVRLRYGWLKRLCVQNRREIAPVMVRNARQTGENAFDFYDDAPYELKRGELCYTPDGSVFFEANAPVPALPGGRVRFVATYSSAIAAPPARPAVPRPSLFRNSRFVICMAILLLKKPFRIVRKNASAVAAPRREQRRIAGKPVDCRRHVQFLKRRDLFVGHAVTPRRIAGERPPRRRTRLHMPGYAWAAGHLQQNSGRCLVATGRQRPADRPETKERSLRTKFLGDPLEKDTGPRRPCAPQRHDHAVTVGETAGERPLPVECRLGDRQAPLQPIREHIRAREVFVDGIFSRMEFK